MDHYRIYDWVRSSKLAHFAHLNWPTSTIRMQGAAGPDQRTVQKRIVRPAARGNTGSGCCQRKHGHNPAKIVPSFALKQTPVQ